jgi:hypothetical protein
VRAGQEIEKSRVRREISGFTHALTASSAQPIPLRTIFIFVIDLKNGMSSQERPARRKKKNRQPPHIRNVVNSITFYRELHYTGKCEIVWKM